MRPDDFTELQLRRRADAGDQNAKRKLEARRVIADADVKMSGLSRKARLGDKEALQTLRGFAAGKATAGGKQASRPVSARADTERAASAARAAERQRWAAVFASEHSKGRERGCVALLTSDQNWAAATICAQLGTLPTDAELAVSASNERTKASVAVWDKAIAGMKGAK